MVKYKFNDIAINSTLKKKPVEDDKYHYIGLEHLDSGSLQVTRYGSEIAPKGEKLVMKKGDVLFGKRRAYQKKVGIAPFDGIFSAHGMVLRPKEDVVDKDFFPLFINSDYFLDAAIKISVGSLSPTINWGDLKELEFELPGLDEQRKLAKILWAAEETKQAYKTLFQKTDDLVKAKFEEMFGNIKKCHLSDMADIIMGQSPDSSTYNDEKNGLPFYQGKTEFGDKYIKEPIMWCSAPTRISEKDDILLSVRAPVGSVNIATEKCCIGRGLAAIRNKNIASSLFLFHALKALEKQIEASGVGSTFKAITKDSVYKIAIPNAKTELQNTFVQFAQQTEQSKQQLQTSLDSLNATMRALINENLK